MSAFGILVLTAAVVAVLLAVLAGGLGYQVFRLIVYWPYLKEWRHRERRLRRLRKRAARDPRAATELVDYMRELATFLETKYEEVSDWEDDLGLSLDLFYRIHDLRRELSAPPAGRSQVMR